MSDTEKPNVEVDVCRGTGLFLHLNGRLVEHSYGAIVMAELAHLRDFPGVRVEIHLSSRRHLSPAAVALLIAAELDRERDLGLDTMAWAARCRGCLPG